MDHAYGKRRRHSPVSNFMQRVKMMVRGSSQRVAFVLFCAFCYLMYVAITGRATSASAGSPVSLDNARIAILTFVTAEHSYLHLSLSDKSSLLRLSRLTRHVADWRPRIRQETRLHPLG